MAGDLHTEVSGIVILQEWECPTMIQEVIPPSRRFPDLTETQEAFMVALTDQRVVNLMVSADFIADLPQETKDFLREAEPETMKFLRRARPEEVVKLESGIKLVQAFETTGRVIKALVVIAFGIWVGFTSIYSWFFGSGKH